MTTQEAARQLDKVRQTLEIRGSDLSNQKVQKIIQTIKDIQFSLSQGVCND